MLWDDNVDGDVIKNESESNFDSGCREPVFLWFSDSMSIGRR